MLSKINLRLYIFILKQLKLMDYPHIAFFEAGESYKGKRFYWQNREKTFTLVGLGHAHVITKLFGGQIVLRK